MEYIMYGTIGIAILVLALLVFYLYQLKKNKKKHTPDYYNLFIMGICFLPLGIPLGNPAFSGMGLIFLIIGLANKDKWKKRKPWKKLSEKEKKKMMLVIAILLLLFLGGILTFFYFAN